MRYPASTTLKMVGLKSSTHKLVLSILADHADNRTWKCNPGISRIAELSLIKERHTQKILRDLERDGFISRIGNSLGGPPGCTCIYLVNQELVALHLIKSRYKRDYVNPDRFTYVSQRTPTNVPHHTPTGAPNSINPCSTAQATPALQHTQTTNELNTTRRSFEDLLSTYGKDWKSKPEIVREIGISIGIEPMRNEGLLDYADRLQRSIK